MRKLSILVAIFTLLWVGNPISTIYADVVPTTQWVNFYSSSSTMDGQPLPVGSVVRAYAATGEQCGEFVVHTAGYYGFLACYVDDPNTPRIEGVRAGESVRFTVDGYEAGSVSVPATISNGARIRFDLTVSTALATNTCIDGYEPDDIKANASSTTGPEGHTFYSEKHGWDQDWSKVTALANWTYQIRARSNQPFDITHPVLRLYDTDGNLLAENEMDKWGRGAEIWWWNSGAEQTIYIQITEKNGNYGCRHYTLEAIPWNPVEFALRFGQ